VGRVGWCRRRRLGPAARTAWLYVGGGDGALWVWMMSLAIDCSRAAWTTVASLGFYLAETAVTLWLLIVGGADLKWQEQVRAD